MHKYIHNKYFQLLLLYANAYIFVSCNVHYVFFLSFKNKNSKLISMFYEFLEIYTYIKFCMERKVVAHGFTNMPKYIKWK